MPSTSSRSNRSIFAIAICIAFAFVFTHTRRTSQAIYNPKYHLVFRRSSLYEDKDFEAEKRHRAMSDKIAHKRSSTMTMTIHEEPEEDRLVENEVQEQEQLEAIHGDAGHVDAGHVDA